MLIDGKEYDVTMEIEEHLPPEKRRFMAKYPRFEPKIRDSTSIRSLKTCPRKYFYEIVLGRVPKETPPYFAWGSAYHTFREVLEVNYGYGHDAPPRYDETKGADAYVLAAQAGLAYWKKHGRDQDTDSKYAFMTTERLLKSFMHAFKHWAREKQQGRIVVLAVEQPFNVQLADGSFTSGKADQIIRWNSKIWGRDFKTSSSDSGFYQRRLEPNDQFTRYTVAEGKLVGEQIQGQFVEMLYNANPTKKDTKGPSIIELTTSRTTYQLKEFEHEQTVINRVLEIYRETDTWPMFDPACPFCPFHSVCAKPSEGAMMAQLETHFNVRPWDNTRIGEERE
jgi:hypothetical protein